MSEIKSVQLPRAETFRSWTRSAAAATSPGSDGTGVASPPELLLPFRSGLLCRSRTPGDNASSCQSSSDAPFQASSSRTRLERRADPWQRREEMIRSKNQPFCVFFEPNCCAQKPERGCETYTCGTKTHTFRYLHQKSPKKKKDTKNPPPSRSLLNVSGLRRSQITKVWSLCSSGAPVTDSLMSRQTRKHVSLSLGSPSLFHRRDGGKMTTRKNSDARSIRRKI